MSATDPKTSILLERWRGGEAAALTQLLNQHSDWIYRHVRSCMSPAVRARLETADLVQESLLEFLENAPRFSIDNGKLFRGLLLKIIERTQLQEYRWWRARRRDIARENPIPRDTVLDLESPRTSPGEAASRHEREAWIRLGLEFLDEADLHVIVLRDFEKLSFTEIGDRLESTKDATRMRYSRAVDQLAAVVGKLRRGELRQLVPRVDD